MINPNRDDPELEELRRRRKEGILARRALDTAPTVASPAPVDLAAASFPGFIESHPRVVVDVWAPWCAPCRTMAPVLDALSKRLFPRVRFAKINADEEPDWTGDWGVSGIPTLLLFHQGQLVDRLVGAHPFGTIEARLRASFHLEEDGRDEASSE